MNYKFFPHTEEDLKQMLEKSGVSSLDELYADVPEAIRFKGDYDLPEAKSEIELREYLHALTQLDAPLTVFAGAGCYDHYAPSIVQNLIDLECFALRRCHRHGRSRDDGIQCG